MSGRVPRRLVIGLDIGTTAVKGVVLDPSRGIVATASRANALSSPQVGWAEASPRQWLDNVVSIIAELVADPAVDASAIVALSTSGMVPAVLAIDANGKPLRPAMLQNDARARTEVAEVADALRDSGVLHATGSPVTQQSVAPTALWLQRHEPVTWAATAALVGSYDWMLIALGSDPHVERNWALESGLYTLDATPFGPAVEVAGVVGRLAPVLNSGSVVGTLDATIASASGLPTDVALVVGGADHVLSAVGAGLADVGDWLIKLGGAGDILAVATAPVVDERFYLDQHPVDGLWLPNGCMATSGSLVRWVQALLDESDLAGLDAEASTRGAAKVLCLPYFLGEKSPLNDPDLRGVFAGLHLGTDRYDLYRAALEGIAFGFRHNAESLRDSGIPLTIATVTNGGATSLLWKTIHASVLGVPLRTVVGHPGASLGAAVAAAIGVGALDGWHDIGAFVQAGKTIDPDATLITRYDDAFGLWLELSNVTAKTMRALARL
jgi:xylulokinase